MSNNNGAGSRATTKWMSIFGTALPFAALLGGVVFYFNPTAIRALIQQSYPALLLAEAATIAIAGPAPGLHSAAAPVSFTGTSPAPGRLRQQGYDLLAQNRYLSADLSLFEDDNQTLSMYDVGVAGGYLSFTLERRTEDGFDPTNLLGATTLTYRVPVDQISAGLGDPPGRIAFNGYFNAHPAGFLASYNGSVRLTCKSAAPDCISWQQETNNYSKPSLDADISGTSGSADLPVIGMDRASMVNVVRNLQGLPAK